MNVRKRDVKAWGRTWTLAFCSLVAASQGMAEVNEEGVELYEHDLSGMPPAKLFEAGASFGLGLGCSSGRVKVRGDGPFGFGNYGVADYYSYAPGSRVPADSSIPSVGTNWIPPTADAVVVGPPPYYSPVIPPQVNEYGDAVSQQWTRLLPNGNMSAGQNPQQGWPNQVYYQFGDVNSRSGFGGFALTFTWDYVTLLRDVFRNAPPIAIGGYLGGGFYTDTARIPLTTLSRHVYPVYDGAAVNHYSSTNIFEQGSVKLRHFMSIEAGAKVGFTVGRVLSFLKLGWAIHCWRMMSPLGIRSKSCWPNAFVVGLGVDMNLTRRMILGVAVDFHAMGRARIRVRQTDLYEFVRGRAAEGGVQATYDRREYTTREHRLRVSPINVISTLQLKLKLPRCREGNVSY